MADNIQFPWGAFEEAQRRKDQNRQQMNQDMAGIGQGLGQGIGAIGQMIQQKKQKEQWQKTINELMVNPNINPQMKSLLPMIAQRPELMGQIGPELLKTQKQQMEWAPLPGGTTQDGQPIFYDKTSHKTEIGNVPGGIKSTGYANTMGPIRKAQFTLQDLPSNQGPSTAGGAAYQVKVAARQGKNLIAKAGSTQRLGLAQGDLARAVLRNSPTDEAMRNANFSQNTINRWNQIKQQVTSDPSALNNPKIRKEMYDIFDEMDKSATPFIKNQLDDMADAGFPVSVNTRKRQMGEMLPEIPFQESPDLEGKKGPPVGTVEGGYKFKGGDPGDQKNWVPK